MRTIICKRLLKLIENSNWPKYDQEWAIFALEEEMNRNGTMKGEMEKWARKRLINEINQLSDDKP